MKSLVPGLFLVTCLNVQATEADRSLIGRCYQLQANYEFYKCAYANSEDKTYASVINRIASEYNQLSCGSVGMSGGLSYIPGW